MSATEPPADHESKGADAAGTAGPAAPQAAQWDPEDSSEDAGTQPSGQDELRALYGVRVVYAGLAVVAGSFVAAVIAYSAAADVSTALAPVTGVVGTIVGAYFGVQVGAQGKESAEQRADARVQKRRRSAPTGGAPSRAASGGGARGACRAGPRLQARGGEPRKASRRRLTGSLEAGRCR